MSSYAGRLCSHGCGILSGMGKTISQKQSENARKQPRERGKFAAKPNSGQPKAAHAHDVKFGDVSTAPPLRTKKAADLEAGDSIVFRGAEAEVSWIGEVNGGARTVVLDFGNAQRTTFLGADDEWPIPG